MEITTILDLVKSRIGLRSAVRDTYLEAIIKGVLSELSDVHGLALVEANPHHLMFVVDYSTWRYQSVTDQQTTSVNKPLSMPRHLQWRLHNLIVGGVKNEDV